ncbi:hypothetical protein Tco_0059257 [Tanacetum coccineum]
MNPIATQQVSLDNALVAPKKRLKIEKCNARIEFSKPQREETYQVLLDALKLSPCYPAFLIFAKVPEELGYSGKCDMLSAIHTDLMHQPWRTFAAILNRCISRKSSDLIGLGYQELKSCGFVSKTQDYQMYGALIPNKMINQDIKDSKAYKTYLDFATGKATPKKARKFKKVASPSKKLSPILEEEHVKKPKRAKKPAKKSTTMPTAALLEAAQLKKTLKKSKLETYKLHASGSSDRVVSQPKVPGESKDKTTGTDEGTSTKPGVPDVPKYQYESENESCGDSDDDIHDDGSNDDDDDVDSDVGGDNESSDREKVDSDKDENPNLNQNKDEEEYKEQYVRTLDSYGFTNGDEEYTELYKDMNVRLKDTVHEEGGKGDVEMTDACCDDVSLQSSSISSDFANQILNLDNAQPVDIELMCMMNVKVCHKEPSTQTPPLLTIPVMIILETSTSTAPTIPPTIPSATSLPQQSTPTPTTTSILALPDFSSLFGLNQRIFVLERDISQLKQVDYSAQLLEMIKSQIPAMVDSQLSTRLEDSIQKAFRNPQAAYPAA